MPNSVEVLAPFRTTRRSAMVAAGHVALLWMSGCGSLPQPAGAQAAAPATVGLSPERLQRMTARFDLEVAAGRLPGAVIMVARRGRLAYAHAFGRRDPKLAEPMQLDSIFRIYSMTKAVVAVAGLMLVEEGTLQLTDSLARWLPAFKEMKVLTPQGEVPAQRPITVHDLFRHTAGFVYGELTNSPVLKEALARAGLSSTAPNFDIRGLSAADMVQRLAELPLAHQPGTMWEYSLATDVLGSVIEVATGKRLGEVLHQRIFEPLRMADTAFQLLPDQAGRLAEPFEKDVVTGAPVRLIDVTRPPVSDSGGSGLVSTAGDYMRFTRMLLGGGQLDGARLLSPATVRWMIADHLGRIPTAPNLGGSLIGASGAGWGLGIAVRQSEGTQTSPGTAGSAYWGGNAGTAFWIDPKEQMAVVFMVQQLGPIRSQHQLLLRQLVYQSIVE